LILKNKQIARWNPRLISSLNLEYLWMEAISIKKWSGSYCVELDWHMIVSERWLGTISEKQQLRPILKAYKRIHKEWLRKVKHAHHQNTLQPNKDWNRKRQIQNLQSYRYTRISVVHITVYKLKQRVTAWNYVEWSHTKRIAYINPVYFAISEIMKIFSSILLTMKPWGTQKGAQSLRR
jgi:hypothetical protein